MFAILFLLTLLVLLGLASADLWVSGISSDELSSMGIQK